MRPSLAECSPGRDPTANSQAQCALADGSLNDLDDSEPEDTPLQVLPVPVALAVGASLSLQVTRSAAAAGPGGG